MTTPQPQPQWESILEASIRTIKMMSPNERISETLTRSLIYDLLDRYGLTKGQIRPILDQHTVAFPEQVVCEVCNSHNEDTDLDDELQPHVYYDECPYCETYHHNEDVAYKRNFPCKGHQYTCQYTHKEQDCVDD